MPSPTPSLADLNDDSSPMPVQITVFCDDCGIERTADYVVAADSMPAERFEAARNHLRANEGWQCDENGDLCPGCVDHSDHDDEDGQD